MSAWQSVPLPSICERAIAVSIPRNNQFLVVSYEGMHLVTFYPTPSVETDTSLPEYAAYNTETHTATFHDTAYPMIGLHGGHPRLNSQLQETLEIRGEQLAIRSQDGTVLTRPFKNFSGDWVTATFSDDDAFVLLACPYDFDFVLLRRTADDAVAPVPRQTPARNARNQPKAAAILLSLVAGFFWLSVLNMFLCPSLMVQPQPHAPVEWWISYFVLLAFLLVGAIFFTYLTRRTFTRRTGK